MNTAAKEAPAKITNVDLCLYKIADAIQIAVTNKGGKITGEQSLMINTGRVQIPLKVKAVKSFCDTHFGVVFHIRGDLYLIVCYYQKNGTVSAFMVDRAKITMSGVGNTPPEMVLGKEDSLAKVVNTLGDAIVKTYFYKGDWQEMKLPK